MCCAPTGHGVMQRSPARIGLYREWPMVLFAGLLGFGFALAVATAIKTYSVSLTSLSLALRGTGMNSVSNHVPGGNQ